MTRDAKGHPKKPHELQRFEPKHFFARRMENALAPHKYKLTWALGDDSVSAPRIKALILRGRPFQLRHLHANARALCCDSVRDLTRFFVYCRARPLVVQGLDNRSCSKLFLFVRAGAGRKKNA